MRKFLILLGIVVCSCNSKDTKVVYIDRNTPIDSNNAFSIRYNEDGTVKDIYINKEHFNNENIIAANNNLNDSSFYEIKKDSLGKTYKIRTFKYDYIKDIYSVYIKNDTVEMGEDFIGTITLSERNILLEIDDSTNYITQLQETPSLRTFTFSKRTNKEGIDKFKGKLKYNDMVIPFEYNYVVTNDFPGSI